MDTGRTRLQKTESTQSGKIATGNDVRILELRPDDKGPDTALVRHFETIVQCLADVKQATAGEAIRTRTQAGEELRVKAPRTSQPAASRVMQVDTPLLRIGDDGRVPLGCRATSKA